MKPLFAASVRDIRRAVQSGGGGGTPGSNALKYNPGQRVPLTSPATRVVGVGTGAQTTITLNSGEHSIIQLPTDQARIGKVRIEGTGGTNNRIWIMGGQIKSATDSNGGATDANDCLNLAGIDHAFIEGVWFDKRHRVGSTCAFASRNHVSGVASAGAVWMQNCLFTGVNYMDTGNGSDGDFQEEHGDFLIFQHLAVRLRMYRCTGWTWNTGFVTSGGWTDGAEFHNCNWNIYDSRFNPKPSIYPGQRLTNSPNHSVSFTNCDTPSNWTFNECYLHDDQPVGTFSLAGVNGGAATTHTKRPLQNLLTDPFNNTPAWDTCGAFTGDPYTGVLDPTISQVTGVVRGGIPPNGHFVNSGTLSYGTQQWPNASPPTHTGNFTGLNYPQPFTSGHPGYLE
jgi:hypothetical protein